MASHMTSAPKIPIHLDGTTLEGGGQLLRLALSLSSVTGIPVYLTDIRGNRKGSQDGGIKPAHLAGASWLANATHANTYGLELKSRTLLFQPSLPVSELDLHEAVDKLSLASDTVRKHTSPTWKEVSDEIGNFRRETSISMSTPGSVFLVLQAILPYLLFASQPAGTPEKSSRASDEAVPLRIVIRGGTNVWNSLSYEYADQVLFPMLYKKLGIEPIKMTLDKRGWSMGSKSIGKVTLDITPLKPGSTLPAFDFSDRGHLTKIQCSILAPSAELLDELKERVSRALMKAYPDIEICFPVIELSGHRSRLYLLVVAETSNGYRLGRDWLFDQRVDHANPTKTARTIGAKVISDLDKELQHGGCVDEFLQDQLTVFQALAQGRSTIKAGSVSLHTETTRWVCEKLLRASFDQEGHCEGIGLVAGQEGWSAPPTWGMSTES